MAPNASTRLLSILPDDNSAIIDPLQAQSTACSSPWCVQTRLMAQEKSDGPAKYRGLLHALATIPREEGIRALYRGLLPRLLRIPPGQAIVWAVSDQITGHFERKTKEEILQS